MILRRSIWHFGLYLLNYCSYHFEILHGGCRHPPPFDAYTGDTADAATGAEEDIEQCVSAFSFFPHSEWGKASVFKQVMTCSSLAPTGTKDSVFRQVNTCYSFRPGLHRLTSSPLRRPYVADTSHRRYRDGRLCRPSTLTTTATLKERVQSESHLITNK